MAELVTLVAVALVLVGTIGSLVPMLPGALVSLGGILLHWWTIGEPSGVPLAVLVLLALTAVALDYFAGALSARAGGASWVTTVVAAFVGLFLAFALGPVGFVAGTAGVVFVAELVRGKEFEACKNAAIYTTVGVVASTVFRFVLNVLVLALFLAFVVM